MTGTPADQAERDRLVGDLHTNLFVEAGAGTGKTTAVVARIIALVAAGSLTMDRLVAITFTVAAAGELRVRIREGLERAAVEAHRPEPERGRCAAAAGAVERARIETIHAFCSAVLRMHPLEAGLPPDFETLAELRATIDVRERFRTWLVDLTDDEDGGVLVRRGLLVGVKPGHLLALFETLDANWDLLADPPGWQASLPENLVARARLVGGTVEACIAMLPHCHTRDPLYERLDALRPVAARLVAAVGEDDAIAALVSLVSSSSTNVGARDNWGVAHGENACTTVKSWMKDARNEASELVADARRHAVTGIARHLREVVLEYAEERRKRGLVSYQDLLVRARNLVRRNAAVRAALQSRWDFFVVDEFQDTDPLQAELAFLLAAEPGDPAEHWPSAALVPGRLCVVGDPKQSIYRFRRADIALYAAVETALTAKDPRARASLQVNFRSGARIVDAVNAVFGGPDGLMAPPAVEGADGMQAPWTALIAHAPEVEGSVSVFGGSVDERAAAMWRQEAETAAATIARIIAEGWQVGEGTTDGPRRCGASDICVLMPSRTNLRNLERALERARLRYRLESGSLMVATQEFRDLLNCLRSIDDPTDEVALVAALRSPAFGCSDVDLLRWHESGGRWSYLWPGEGGEPRVAEALGAMRALNELRPALSVPALVEEVVSRRLLRAAAADDWRPHETLRRLRFVTDQVRALGRTGRTTLHDAVEYLELLARDPRYDSVAAGGDAEDCIRVMTIHAAKGLEFPIVVLTGLGRKPNPSRPQLVADRMQRRVEVRLTADFSTSGFDELDAREKLMEKCERQRLLYVALTRPRDHLVVSLFHGETGGKATDAHEVAMRIREHAEVLHTIPGVFHAEPVRPAPAAGDAEAHRRDEDAWLSRREALIASRGALCAMTATGLAHEPEEPAPEAAGDVASQRRGRGATALGRAVHAVLQVADLESLAGLSAQVVAQAHAEGIPERSADVERLARAACASEAVKAAARSRHWREVPVGALVDGVVLEGFVDLLYEDADGRLAVLDYKTDSVSAGEIDTRMERYQLQGGVYALLTAEATGRQVSRVEFVFAATGETRTITDVAGCVAAVRTKLAEVQGGGGGPAPPGHATPPRR